MNTLIDFARKENIQEFNFFRTKARPSIKNEIENVKKFFKCFPETKYLSLISIYAKNQQSKNTYPLQEYGINNNTQKLSDIVNENICVGNLIYYQGYPIEAYANISFSRGETLMHRAAFQNNIIALNIAFQTSPLSLNTQDQDGFTPIGSAISGYSYKKYDVSDLIKILIKNPNFDINKQCTSPGDTPLIFAFRRRMPVNIIDILLNCKEINLQLTNNSQETALIIAKKNQKTSMNQEMYSEIAREQDQQRLNLLENKILQQQSLQK